MPKIHCSSDVDSSCEIAEGVEIGPFCVIGPKVKIGQNTIVGPQSTIAYAEIGESCRILGAKIGGEPQYPHGDVPAGRIKIGNSVIIREYVTIHRAIGGDSLTSIGDQTYLMVSSHIAHDCLVGSRCLLINWAALGGYVVLEDEVRMDGYAFTLPHTRLGRRSRLGAKAYLRHNLPPYTEAWGNPAGIQRPRKDLDQEESDAISRLLEELELFQGWEATLPDKSYSGKAQEILEWLRAYGTEPSPKPKFLQDLEAKKGRLS